jgi:hypothetical protein
LHTTTLTAAYGAIVTLALAAAITRAHHATALSAERLAAARAAGYRQGLTHAALGLLETPAPTRVDTDTNTGRTTQ